MAGSSKFVVGQHSSWAVREDKEERATGAVSAPVYWSYVRACTVCGVLIAVLAQLGWSGTKTGINLWLSEWSSAVVGEDVAVAVNISDRAGNLTAAEQVMSSANFYLEHFESLLRALTLRERLLAGSCY